MSLKENAREEISSFPVSKTVSESTTKTVSEKDGRRKKTENILVYRRYLFGLTLLTIIKITLLN